MRRFSIYIIKNKINDKVYIGQTCLTPKERFGQHMKPSTHKIKKSYKIYNAMNKYGKENFYFEVLEENILEDEINKREVYYIDLYDSYNNGYNSTRGGDGRSIIKIEDVELLRELFEDGLTYKEIAEVFDVDKVTIQRTLSSLKLKRNKIVTEEYLIKNKDVKTNIEMAKELGVHPETVSRAFKKFGIERGKGCNNKLNPQNKQKITKEILEQHKDLPKKEIAKILNTDTSYIYILFKKYKI